MDFAGFASGFIIGIGCVAAAAFLLGLLFVDFTDKGWLIRVPW